ncbi:DUF1214 domain-containing protein [Phenylobacterium sp. 58.2.17]|jgi:hypothetical protein|uniref:DUF1214 domain-containing protein n=1 Tax=Phenylobacterium sp. 58.2.17 TaxID=2969306 RepID=UPI002263C5C8|nr:DUF1214 domain-containing protein [Phenylobacterium sp. 58.2.17]MCX7586343.1 DUF1214 domain-containing protein [Phenylobacterium sp. 58.2.17]
MAEPVAPNATSRLSDEQISDAYIYLLGRLLITRQQQVDFDTEGLVWNQLVHRKPGQVDWPNPNLDVAYSEAWVALDQKSFLLVTVPAITGRYYVVEFLDGWGETVANINERVYPDHPNGLFAVCLAGSQVEIPTGAQRVDVPGATTRVLLRVELGADWDEAIALQHGFKFEIHGDPQPPEIPRTVMFDIAALPGVEAFDSAEAALGEKDSGTGMEDLQADVRAIANAIKDPAERARIDAVVRQKAQADFAAAAPRIGRGTIRNGWARPACCGHWGDDWMTRTTVNYGGIWANVFEEVLYYRGAIDSTGAALEADGSYTLTFPADDLPSKYAKYFWSVIAVDRLHRRVLPNPLNRFLLNKESKLSYGADGSLKLYFSPEKPADAPDGNWLPTGGKPWSLTFRFYGPRGGVADGSYFPPPLERQ